MADPRLEPNPSLPRGPRIRLAAPPDAAILAQLRYELRTGLGWLAEEAQGEPLGTVWVQLVEKLPNPVHEPGLHAYLLDTALAACAERGIDTVFLWPTPRSRGVYARHGFAEAAGVMERRLWSRP